MASPAAPAGGAASLGSPPSSGGGVAQIAPSPFASGSFAFQSAAEGANEDHSTQHEGQAPGGGGGPPPMQPSKSSLAAGWGKAKGVLGIVRASTALGTLRDQVGADAYIDRTRLKVIRQVGAARAQHECACVCVSGVGGLRGRGAGAAGGRCATAQPTLPPPLSPLTHTPPHPQHPTHPQTHTHTRTCAAVGGGSFCASGARRAGTRAWEQPGAAHGEGGAWE